MLKWKDVDIIIIAIPFEDFMSRKYGLRIWWSEILPSEVDDFVPALNSKNYIECTLNTSNRMSTYHAYTHIWTPV